MNFAEKIKKQTDRILRQQKLDPAQGITVTGSPEGGSTVVNPGLDLARHKVSADHDGRYYTEDEVDALIMSVSIKYEPLTNGNEACPEIVFFDGDVIMQEVS